MSAKHSIIEKISIVLIIKSGFRALLTEFIDSGLCAVQRPERHDWILERVKDFSMPLPVREGPF